MRVSFLAYIAVVLCCIQYGGTKYVIKQGMYGLITSESFPQPYGNNINDSWLITTQNGLYISLYFTYFDVEDSYDVNTVCPDDRVEIYDGTEESDVNIRLCGNPVTYPASAPRLFTRKFVSTGPKMTVRFISDFSNEIPDGLPKPRGFRANYAVKDINECRQLEIEYNNSPEPDTVGRCDHYCNNVHGSYYCSCKPGYHLLSDGFTCVGECSGNVITNEEGDIMTPGYPDLYPRLTDCDWVISTQPGKIIQLEFDEDFDIENHTTVGSCPYDWLQVSEGKSNTKYCGPTRPLDGAAFKSKGAKLNLAFHSDSAYQKKGFKIHYTARSIICPMPSTPANGRILQTYGAANGYLPYNSVVVFECHSGTKMMGVHKIKCLKDGSWNARTPTCVPI